MLWTKIGLSQFLRACLESCYKGDAVFCDANVQACDSVKSQTSVFPWQLDIKILCFLDKLGDII